MKAKIHKLYFLGLMTITTAGIIACSDDDFQSESNDPMRMFTPLSLAAENLEKETLVTWKASLYTDDIPETYTAEVSTDSLFVNPAEIILSKATDSAGVVITDQEIPVRKNYFVRVKTNAYEDRPESYWSASKRIRISGTQIMHPIYDPNIQSDKVTFSWDVTPNVTSVRIQAIRNVTGQDEPENIGEPIISDISSSESSAGQKTVNGLNPGTLYNIEIYQENTSVGYRTFRTKASTEYSTILNAGDDLVATVNASENGAIIGLNPGVYDVDGNNININGKSITIQSTSSDPNNTKIQFKEFVLNDTGAGLQLKGLELDGSANNAAYLINLTSSSNNGTAANFENVLIDNCIVHNVSTSAFRANRGPANGYKIDKFEIKYSLFKNFAVSTYGFLHLDKLIFNEVNLENSTFTEIGDLFIRYRENISSPAANTTINVTNCTINSIGHSQAYPLLDNNNVAIKFNFSNNILANVPRVGGVISNTNLVRIASTTSASLSFNNFYNLTNGNAAELQNLVIPTGVSNSNNQTQNLNWTSTTTDFTLPANSPLRSASSTGGAIGDPRWWN